jgi:hypothetical protein
MATSIIGLVGAGVDSGVMGVFVEVLETLTKYSVLSAANHEQETSLIVPREPMPGGRYPEVEY